MLTVEEAREYVLDSVRRLEETDVTLLEALGLNPALVVVERNRQILDRSRYAEVEVDAGDVLELVHFVGGG